LSHAGGNVQSKGQSVVAECHRARQGRLRFRLEEFLKAVLGRVFANAQTIRWATQKPVLAQIIEQVPHGFTAIDVGCGGGTYAIELLAPRFQRVFAIDINWDHAWMTRERARRKGLGNIHVVVASAEQVPFKDGVADLVLCCEVLEHIRDDEAALLELSRIGRPGGRLVCSVPHPPEPHPNPAHVREGYKPAELKEKLQKAGFLVKTVRFCMFSLSRTVTRLCSVTRLPLPLLFICQIENWLSQSGVSLSNPYDVIVLARQERVPSFDD